MARLQHEKGTQDNKPHLHRRHIHVDWLYSLQHKLWAHNTPALARATRSDQQQLMPRNTHTQPFVLGDKLSKASSQHDVAKWHGSTC